MKKSKTSLFLMELIISIFLFSVTAAICTSLFVQTHLKSKETRQLQIVLTNVQNITALIESQNYSSLVEYFDFLNTYYPEMILCPEKTVPDQGTDEYSVSRIYFNDIGNICSPSNAECYLEIVLSLKEQMLFVQLFSYNFESNNENEPICSEIYNFHFQKYLIGCSSSENGKEVSYHEN